METTDYMAELIRGRHSKRGFLDQPVPLDTVRDILSVAKYAPSSSNTQPWRCYVLTGRARENVADAAVTAYRANPDTLAPEYPFFPKELPAPFATRFQTFRGMLGDAQGVQRSDLAGRRRDVERQFRFFGAPVGLIFTMDRRLEWASFLCYGCFLQNIMLAARARGLDTCPQQIWSLQSTCCALRWPFPRATWWWRACRWATRTTASPRTTWPSRNWRWTSSPGSSTPDHGCGGRRCATS